MATIVEFSKSAAPARTIVWVTIAWLAAVFLVAASPARADRCEDIANQLKSQVDGVKVGLTAANVVYLSHPLAKELSLGCANQKYSNELYAKADGRKPKPEFVQLVAGAAAIVFTLPKDDMFKGVSRCFSRIVAVRASTIFSRPMTLSKNSREM